MGWPTGRVSGHGWPISRKRSSITILFCRTFSFNDMALSRFEPKTFCVLEWRDKQFYNLVVFFYPQSLLPSGLSSPSLSQQLYFLTTLAHISSSLITMSKGPELFTDIYKWQKVYLQFSTSASSDSEDMSW